MVSFRVKMDSTFGLRSRISVTFITMNSANFIKMKQGAVTRVPKWEPGGTKGTWCQKGTQVPISKIQKYFCGKLPKNVNFDKKIDEN